MPSSTARSSVPDSAVDPRVVPGADRVEAERERPVEHRLELDLLVAAQARVGGPARRVLGDEVVHHVLLEPLGQVPDVERDADHVGGAARVPRVLERAAAARPGPVRLRIRRQRKMDAGHLMTGVDRASRRGGGVDSARHSGKNLKPHNSPGYPPPTGRWPRDRLASRQCALGHLAAKCAFGPARAWRRGAARRRRRRRRRPAAQRAAEPAARRARVTASPMHAPRASTSAWVVVWPSEKRSEPRARASSAPIASST